MHFQTSPLSPMSVRQGVENSVRELHQGALVLALGYWVLHSDFGRRLQLFKTDLEVNYSKLWIKSGSSYEHTGKPSTHS